ncbi:hypothetical protein C2845_PM09G15550 [Panicum miliaceum]|uniref:GTD-binding domain-containing protein n=1 Tax=Panicum miliaceum TaxID=4540 RepID=A0A3L6RX40_PANMI|nr:hypothetical protein C2845_PM09G15550 [Panicum miliaceum]
MQVSREDVEPDFDRNDSVRAGRIFVIWNGRFWVPHTCCLLLDPASPNSPHQFVQLPPPNPNEALRLRPRTLAAEPVPVTTGRSHGRRPRPGPLPAVAGGWYPCCSSASPAVPWRRSVKRKLGVEKGEGGGGQGDSAAARVDAAEECAALRDAVAAAQSTASALRAEVEEERLAAASTASETMAMMLRLQREKAEVQMEFRRFADEKMALDAAEIDQLREYRLQSSTSASRSWRARNSSPRTPRRRKRTSCSRVRTATGGYYPELRCHNGEYYYEDGQEEEDAVALDLERRICRLEHDQETHLVELVLEEEEGTQLYTDDALPELAGLEQGGFYANEMLPEEAVEERSQLYNYEDEELQESPTAGFGGGEETSETAGAGSASGNNRVYTIDKVHQGVSAPITRVLEKYQDEAVEPDIKKLYMRLESLEADRESMRQALAA